MTVFGVDFSLTSTGLASWDGEAWDIATIKSSPEDPSRSSFLARIDDIAARVVNWCDPHEGDVFFMEGPSFGSRKGQLDRMFGGWWLVFKALTEHHGEPWIITPTELKQLATGNGNAAKEEVLIQAVRRIPDAGITNNDESDAAWLAVAGSIIHRAPAVSLPAKHLEPMKKYLA